MKHVFSFVALVVLLILGSYCVMYLQMAVKTRMCKNAFCDAPAVSTLYIISKACK